MTTNLPLENERVATNNRCPTVLDLMQYARPGGSVRLIIHASFAFREPHFRPECDSLPDTVGFVQPPWDATLNAYTPTECPPLTWSLYTNR